MIRVYSLKKPVMTTVRNNSQWSSSAAFQQSSPSESRGQFLSSLPDNAPLSPTSAPPLASCPTSDPPAACTSEYGDDDIDDVLFEPIDNSSSSASRNGAASNLQLQNKEKTTRSKRMQRKPVVSPINMSLYDGSCTQPNSNYNHLDPTHMFAVLEQIQREQEQQEQQPPIDPSPTTPAAIEHDDFGYAVPSKNKLTGNAEPVAYAVVDVTQKRLSRGKNKETVGDENGSSVSSHLLQPEARTKLTYTRATEPAIVTVPDTEEKSDEEIEPYATVNIVTMNGPVQKHKVKTHRELAHTSNDDAMETHITHFTYKSGDSDPNAKVTKPRAKVTTDHSTIADETIEPYATVDVPHVKKSMGYKASVVAKTHAPVNGALSKLEMDNANMYSKAMFYQRSH